MSLSPDKLHPPTGKGVTKPPREILGHQVCPGAGMKGRTLLMLPHLVKSFVPTLLPILSLSKICYAKKEIYTDGIAGCAVAKLKEPRPGL